MIDNEASIRENKDNEIISLLSKEKDDRESKDNELEANINNSINGIIDGVKLIQDPKNNLHYTLMVGDLNKGEINIPEDKMLERLNTILI